IEIRDRDRHGFVVRVESHGGAERAVAVATEDPDGATLIVRHDEVLDPVPVEVALRDVVRVGSTRRKGASEREAARRFSTRRAERGRASLEAVVAVLEHESGHALDGEGPENGGRKGVARAIPQPRADGQPVQAGLEGTIAEEEPGTQPR